jgi:2-oxoglutarate dehydrogenase E2 component (dihydrolipoamide succinyltransferase)
VNAPEAGTITELLVEEESTVTVGQEIAKMELGNVERPKEERHQIEPKSTDSKEEGQKESDKQAPKEPQTTKQETQPTSHRREEPKPQPSAKPSPPPPSPQKKPIASKQGDEEKKFTLWSRDERRVS